MSDIVESEWNINSDIYDIVESIDNLKKNYIQDEDESTLALGIYGFITDTESKKIQSSVMIAGENGNEMFPTRANLTKNVLVHALFNNITDINAVPASILLNIGLRISDLEKYGTNNGDGTISFYIDCDSGFAVIDPNTNDNVEFHVDYDIMITKHMSEGKVTYTAMYIMKDEKDLNKDIEHAINRISNITNPYLLQPFKINIDNEEYLLIQSEARQYSITTIEDRLVANTLIENKTYTFEFDDQFVDMDVVIEDYTLKTTTLVKPLLYGSRTEGVKDYCWYMFINSYTIRIIFDHKSYIPGINCKISLKMYTTLGTDGEFKIIKNDGYSKQLFVELSSKKYGYNKLNTYTVATTDSENALNAKTKEDLQKLIPKAALSRGSITTETDVLNYFNLIDTDKHRLFVKKKVDNQISRMWYSYFLIKDVDNNIIPTNTLNLRIKITDCITADDGRLILPAGQIIEYTPNILPDDTPRVISEADLPDYHDSDAYFKKGSYYYMNPYNIIINPDPLYAAFYVSIVNQNSWLKYEWVNTNVELQFVALNYIFKRSLINDTGRYNLQLTVTQSILESFYIEGGVNLKVVLVLYNDAGEPYKWKEMQFIEKKQYSYVFNATLDTDNSLDDDNKMKLETLNDIGMYNNDSTYGYFDTEANGAIYILSNIEREAGRYDLDDICGDRYTGYSVTNKYNLGSGLKIYENFTNILDTRIYKLSYTEYMVTEVPMVGCHYIADNNDNAEYFLDAIIDKKDYIDYCLELFENSMGIDYKYFNTYGPSITYHLGGKSKKPLDHVDLKFKFRLSAKSDNDLTLRDEILVDIKEYIEDLYNTGDLHIPNLITYITDKYAQRINYIEYMNFNDNPLGIQHIEKYKEDELDDTFIVPEFLCIRNIYDAPTDTFVPSIEIEMFNE